MYLHILLNRIASAAMYIFTGAYFLKVGMPLHFVLLFYGLEFGIRGVLCPFGLKYMNRVGMLKAVLTASLLFILFFIGVSLSENNLFIGFSSLLFASLAGAIYYPMMDVFEALFVKDNKNRAKQISLSLVFKSLGTIIGSAGVGFILASFGFIWVVVVISVALMLSVIPFIWLEKKAQSIPKISPNDVYKFLFTPSFKEMWKPFFGQQLMIIVNIVMIPIFIFSIVEGFDYLGYILAAAVIIETVFTLTSGHLSDKYGLTKMLRISSITYPCALILYSVFAKSPFTAFLSDSIYKINWNIFETSFRPHIHRHGRDTYKENLIIFGAGWQMALCFGEVLVLPLYALLAYFIGMNIFYVSIICASIGLWMILHHATSVQKEAA